MLRSMFTAIGSLTMHQSYMDVVANNLANVNTTGFKGSRVTFQDQISELLQSGSGPTTTLGGINPTQIGLGMRMGAVSQGFTQGALQSSGRPTDVALQGDGFFIYRDGVTPYYSRDGSLEMDANGMLVNGATGMRLQGWTASGSAATINTGNPIGDITIPLNASQALATVNATMRGNLNSLTAVNGTYTSTIAVYDSLGSPHTVNLTYTKTAPGTWTIQAAAATGSGDTVSIAGGTVTYDATGQYTGPAAAPQITLTPPATSNATFAPFSLDMSQTTQLANPSDVALANQDGLQAGALTGFKIAVNTGLIVGMYSNGLERTVGQVALANFVNPGALEKKGQNLYTAGLNSGAANIGTASTGGRGTVISGYLEASNVDMGQEFTNMILAQRGFQASSRVITTSDEMLQELVNLKR